jgi:hypothetical protein
MIQFSAAAIGIAPLPSPTACNNAWGPETVKIKQVFKRDVGFGKEEYISNINYDDTCMDRTPAADEVIDPVI